jgi:DNA polymerase-3 subunit delta'
LTDDPDARASTPEAWVPPLPWQRAWLAETLRERDRAHHALLIVGPAGLGKKILALNLAQALLCESPRPEGLACGKCAGCGYVAARTHPDMKVLDLFDYDEKPEEWIRVNEVGIERVRQVTRMLETSAHRAGSRIAVISPAERLTDQASNALLKTLEEPPPGAMLILVAHQPGRLMPTVTSRCLRVDAPRPAEDEALAWLRSQGVADPAEALAESGGAPLAALALAEPAGRAERGAWFDALSRPDRLVPMAMGARIEAGGKDERKPRLAAALDALVAWTADLARVSAGGRPLRLPGRADAMASLAPRVARIGLCRYHRSVLLQRAYVSHPLQPRLVVEGLLAGYVALFD